jgi:glutamate-1-semialdehyde 2,1-aminomutase
MSAGWDPISEYKAKTRKSAEWFEHARTHLPGGVTGNVKFYQPYPVFAKRARGSHLWDLDGNDYIDYMLCFGPLILGHGHPAVLKAINEQLARDGTTIFGPPHELELKMAERLNRIFPSAESCRFTNSGLEATMHALRVARGFKKRNRVAKFEGHYFTLQSVQVLPFNDIEDTVRLIKAHKSDLAAVIIEPVQRGFIASDPEFLKIVREITEELDIVLIFDEVMSGFRMDRLGGAQTMMGITPDLMCLGKIIGGGFPCGAFLGRKDIMDVVNPVSRSKDDRVFHGGTFNGHPTVLAAGMATLDVLEKPETYPYLNRITDRLQDGFNELFDRLGVNAQAIGPGSTFNIVFSKEKINDYRDAIHSDGANRQKFDYGMLARGIHFHPDKPFYTCTEHTDKDIDRTLEVAEEVLNKMRA